MRMLMLWMLVGVGLTSPLGAAPAEVTRVLRTFDFEERRLGNEEELPMHWIKVEGPGLPHYVNAQLSTDRAHGGKFSFRFDLNGGSLLYRYEPGQLKVQAGAHYRVEGFCQTTALPRARARIIAYFTDADGHLLPQSVRRSMAYASTSGDESWKKLSVELTADDPKAAYLVLELGLLQADYLGESTLGKRSLYVQDMHGSAWFDDITVSQVPQVSLTTDHPGNIFSSVEPVRLNVVLNDRFVDDLQARLTLTDAAGHEVYQRSGALDMHVAEWVGPNRRKMFLDLPQAPPGWYEAALSMSSGGQFLGEEKLDLILLADTGSRSVPDPRFGIVATNLPQAGWSMLPQILPYLSAGRVKLAVWSHDGDVQQIEPASFDRLLEDLESLGITPTGCLTCLPPSVASKVGGAEFDRLLKADRDAWQPQLAYLVSRHANHLNRWQLGADGSDAFVTDPLMRQVYTRVYREFSQLVGAPDLAMPWPAWYELQGELPATVALSLPPSVLPSQLPLYIQDLHGAEGHNLSLNIELLDREQYGRDMQTRDLAQRFIYALSAGANRIDLPLPFSARQKGEQLVQQPQELFIILRTLTTILGGSTYQGRVPLADGVEAFLFDRGGQGIIALWDRGSVGGVKSLAVNLGERASQVDLWGNVRPLFHSASGGDDRVSLSIGPEPFFLVDIDGAQAQMRASLSMDRPLLESSFEPHMRQIRFTNHYRQAISGMLRLKGPYGWTLNPPTFQFSLNPGETFDHEVSIEFPYNSFAGPKTISCDFSILADRASKFTVPLVLQLGLSDLGMQSLALRDGGDVVVQQILTNYGEHPIDYSAFAVYPGQARQERLVTNLGPGRTTLKRYRFVNVKFEKGAVVRVGVKELSGTRILNDEAEIR